MESSHYNKIDSQMRIPSVAIARPVTPIDTSSDEREDSYSCNENFDPKGLTGLRNLGLTCYFNAGIQALSNSLPLCNFMRDCSSFILAEKKQVGVAWPFQHLLEDMWTRQSFSNIVPSSLYHSFRTLYPMFRPFSQQDSQEFLRYFMDQLHQEIREPHFPPYRDLHLNEEEEGNEQGTDDSPLDTSPSLIFEEFDEYSHSDEEEEFESCDSGLSNRSSASSSCSSIGGGSKRNLIQRGTKSRKRRQSWKLPLENRWNKNPEVPVNVSETSSSFLDLKTPSFPFPKSSHSGSSSGIGSSKPSLSSGGRSTHERDVSAGNFSRSSKFSSDTDSQFYTSNKMSHCSAENDPRRRKQVRYRSIVSDCFDGVLVSSVQCLTCNRTSSRKETFQDLSLPIPSSDTMLQLQQHSSSNSSSSASSPSPIKAHQNLAASSLDFGLSKKSASDASGDRWILLWVWMLWGWVKSWLWGPSVSLMSCLAAFFSADELKGDNMYSCEKCGKLRNGVKYSKVIQLPEILIVHLKRFRHDYVYSSKISQYVSFPMQDLDLTPFLHKDCSSTVRTYDLYSVICHHGAVGGGHYTCYSLNANDDSWYEFDDQCVTQVNADVVANCEAYVLFYKKSSLEMLSRRQRTVELMQVSSRELTLMQFYVSKQWINKFNTFSEPGPVDNSDFLCPHGGVQPHKVAYVDDLVMAFSQGVWEYLHQVFGGGPACTSLYECITCRERQDALRKRQKDEHEAFIKLLSQFQEVDFPEVVYALSLKWYRLWEAFVLRRSSSPPGPVDNSCICVKKNEQIVLKQGSDYAPISKDMWSFFHGIYGGGPDLFFYCGNPNAVSEVVSPHVNQTPNYERTTREKIPPNMPHEGKLMPPIKLRSFSANDLPFSVPSESRCSDEPIRSFSADELVFSSTSPPSEDEVMVALSPPENPRTFITETKKERVRRSDRNRAANKRFATSSNSLP